MAYATSFDWRYRSGFLKFAALRLRPVRCLLRFNGTFQRTDHPHPALSRSASGVFWREAGLGATRRGPLCSARHKSLRTELETRPLPAWPAVGSDLNPTEGLIPAQQRYYSINPANNANNAPTITDIGNQTTSKNIATGPISRANPRKIQEWVGVPSHGVGE